VNIIDVIEAEGVTMIDKGEYFQGNCPFHSEAHPSFVVYKDPGTRFYCFGCTEGGDVIDFIMKIKDINFTEAVKYLGVPHNTSQVFIPFPPLIEQIIELDGKGCKKEQSQYKELLKAMGFIKED
jgi:hypothetical protein